MPAGRQHRASTSLIGRLNAVVLRCVAETRCDRYQSHLRRAAGPTCRLAACNQGATRPDSENGDFGCAVVGRWYPECFASAREL